MTFSCTVLGAAILTTHVPKRLRRASFTYYENNAVL